MKYYLKTKFQDDWVEVTEQQYAAAMSALGLRTVGTWGAGFDSALIAGKIVEDRPMKAWATRYFLKADWQKDWTEVTKEQYIAAEQAAGFHSNGYGPATAEFDMGSVHGRTEYK